MSGDSNGVPAEDWMRRLAAPMQRARVWCLLLALGLLVLAAQKLWEGGALVASGTGLLHVRSLLDGLLALSGAVSAWYLFRAASALAGAHRSGNAGDAREGYAQLARYFMFSAISSALGLLLLVAGIASAVGQVMQGLGHAGL